MSEPLRKSGLDIVGDVPWGTHFCQFYRTAEDLLDILVPYFAEGLRHNEFCMWVTSEPLGTEAARAAIAAAVPGFDAYQRKGQIEILSHSEWYTEGGTFDADRVLNAWVAKLEAARAAGFEGLRLTGNTFWLEPKDWRAFTDYEEAIDGVIGRYRMLAVCTYSLDRCGFGEILDVIRNHRFALVRREGQWEVVENAERRRSEAALRTSEERFRNLFSHMTEGCALHEIVLDQRGRPVDYRFLDVNAAFERLTGLSRERTVGRLVTEVLPGIEPFWIETYGRVAVTGQPAAFEHHYPPPLDRTYRISAYRPAPGQFGAVFEDVTDRKRTESALQESHEELEVTAEELRQQNEELLRVQADLHASEELFRVVTSSTPDHVLVQDGDLRYTLVVNPQLGLTERDMIGKTDLDILSEEDARRLTAIKRGVLTTGKPVRVEMPVSSPDGPKEHFEGSYVPRLGADGRPVGLIGYFRNVTERKRAEEAQRRLAQFPEQNPNAVLRIALDGGLVYANPPARELIEALGGLQGGQTPHQLRTKMEEAARRAGVIESELEDGLGRIFWFAAVRPEGETYVNLYARNITARKRAEQKSAQGAHLLARVHDAVIGADPDMHVTYWNKGAELLFGYAEAEALGRTTVDLLRPAYGPGEREAILEALARAGTSEAVIRLTHKDGRQVDVEAHSTRLAEKGRTSGYAVVYRDITERLAAEKKLQESLEELEVTTEELRQQNEELLRVQTTLLESEESLRRSAEQLRAANDGLRESEERLARAQEMAHLGSWELDLPRNALTWSEEVYRIFGIDRADFSPTYETFLEAIHPDDRAAVDEAFTRSVREDRDGYDIEHRVVRADTGEVRTVHEKCRHVRDGAGQIIRSVGMVHDITEQKRAEDLRQALIEQERLRLGAAVEQASEAVVMVDSDGAIRYVNAAFESTNQVRRSEAVGRTYFEFLAGDPAADIIARSVLGGRAWRGSLSRRRLDGRAIELEVAISTITDPEGKRIGGLVTEKDVTQENAVQRQLRQGQKMEALGTLAGGITHDFNNILGAIVMNTELALLDLEPSHPAREVLPTVLHAAGRGKELVKQIITFSRQKEWDRKLIDITPVVQESIRFLRSTLPGEVAIHEKIAADCGAVLGDASQLNQVVVNLCQNAAQAMAEGGGRIDVGLEPVEVDAEMVSRHPDLKAGSYVRLTVGDTGRGMSREVAERIFEPFFTTRAERGGSGLGLAVVHGIVKAGGGTITVYSEPGRGSTFGVYLPRLEARVAAATAAEASRPTAGHERILVVEDETAQRTSLARSLKRLGYGVTARASGGSALAVFRKDPSAFDLVITDQTMPKMSGLELAAAVTKARPKVPVILCTGFSEKIDGAGAARETVRAFIMKPFSLGEITRLIRSLLD